MLGCAHAAVLNTNGQFFVTNKMWGGRFQLGPDAIMEEINASIGFDRRLFAQDIAGSKAHAAMLAKQGIISKSDAANIRKGLDAVQAEIEAGTFTFSRALEDIHLNVELRLKELIGPAAGRLHTARSRNDQVATDSASMCAIPSTICGQLKDLQRALAEKAETHAATIMPGFTHLQVAQAGHLWPPLPRLCRDVARDRSRLADARKRMNENPLGAAALAGTSFPIDRHATARALGFTGRHAIRSTPWPTVTSFWKRSPPAPSVRCICRVWPRRSSSGRRRSSVS